MNRTEPAKAQGVRKLTLRDQAPDCEIRINRPLYSLADMVQAKRVADIGCGYGANRKLVEAAGGEWVGVEPFEGGAHTVVGDAQDLPFGNETFDVVIMDAVLEHIPDVGKAFTEVARILRPGGKFIGYVAFMECFHEISYSHLSYKALEHYSSINGMRLTALSGGSAFGIDYHLRVLLYPMPFGWGRKAIAALMRGTFKVKSYAAYWGLRLSRKMKKEEARELSTLYYQVECLRQSNGFQYIIEKPLMDTPRHD